MMKISEKIKEKKLAGEAKRTTARSTVAHEFAVMRCSNMKFDDEGNKWIFSHLMDCVDEEDDCEDDEFIFDEVDELL